LLPFFTIALFLLQQQMFMPPATDDQTKSQQKMMKYMVIFIGYLYYTVPSGLCLYIIVSSAWGIAERKLLPASKKKTDELMPAPVRAKSSDGNGVAAAKRDRKKQRGGR
jgi:YidC/Oxa1 family membrane protein insertase